MDRGVGATDGTYPVLKNIKDDLTSNKGMKMAKTARKIEVTLEYQNYIETPPVKPAQMYGQACSSDTVTIESWRKIWLDNVNANHKHFGSFKEYSLGKLFNANQYKPAICVGSGPSLGVNAHELKNKGAIPVISCLHNYHLFEDNEIPVDYFVTLDAGPVVLEEVSEGGKKTEAEYWESTKDKTLIAFIGSDPKLFDKWKGKVYLFNAPVPDKAYIDNLAALEAFNVFVSNGGNVLGACFYIAKAFMGSNPIAFMGADFAFGYNKKFHSWDSKYDAKLGNVMRGVDVYGNKVLTWPSYFNFKNWFDYISLTVPGIYVNCTEGGMLGAYPEGNLMTIKQMSLEEFLGMYRMNEVLKESCENPEKPENRLLF